jgi:Glycosyltransferase family 87
VRPRWIEDSAHEPGISSWADRVRSFADRRLDRDRVRFVCLAVLAINLMLAAASFLTSDGTHTVFGPARGFDFAGFYTAGRILNAWPSPRLYDLDLQDRVFHELLPGLPPETKLPYVYPPFFSLLFRPPALLPYPWACLAWMLLSAGLYLGGLALIWHGVEAIPAPERSTALLLALSFQPFAECWLSGQASTFGFVAMALALHCEARGRPFGVGLSLALCLYKPPLLILVVPMLVMARRSRVLVGFAAGGMALALVSVLAVGWRGCVAYVHHIGAFSHLMRSPTTRFPNWKFIDLDHFLGSMFDRHGLLRLSALVLAALAVLPFLIRSWWALDRQNLDRRMLTWSATLTWTSVLNAYIGVYDAILIVPGLVISADAHWRRAGTTATAPAPAFKYLLALVFVVPWISQHLARSLGFQPFTLVLMGLGSYQLALAGRDVAGEEIDGPRRFRDATALAVIR